MMETLPGVTRRSWCALCLGLVLWEWTCAPSGAQAPPAPSSGEVERAPGRAGVAGEGEGEGEVAANSADAYVQSLIAKAEEGDSNAALQLGNRFSDEGRLDAAAAYFQKAAEADVVEAQEKLALLLLRSSNQALWPQGHGWLDQAVVGGSVKAMEMQAEILLNGSHGREKATDKAIELLEKARVLPDSKSANYLLGRLALRGVGMDVDERKALGYFEDGMRQGSVPCYLEMHRVYRDGGKKIPANLQQAEKLAREAATQYRSSEAAFLLGLFFEEHSRKAPEWDEAGRWLQFASDQGSGSASQRLGDYHQAGRLSGGKADLGKAVELFRLGAEQGDALAAYRLGQLYESGEGLPQDSVAAAAWCRIAGERGNLKAVNEYGMRLLGGAGVTRNPGEAARWFLIAAQAGLPAAQVNLGELNENGVGIPRNPAEAARLYQVAARSGHAGAQARMARLLASGQATGAPDPVGAAFWAARAASAENERYQPLADELRKPLTVDQRGELARRLDDL